MNKILLGLGIVVLGIVGFLYPKIQPTDYSKITQLEQQVGDLSLKVSQNTDAFGAISIPSAPYLFQTTLSAAISSTGNSMVLVNGTLKDGTSLTGYQCFTVDTGTASAEYICGTASGTAITGLLRGINPLNPAATSTALAFAHRRGADVRISDFPILQVLKRLNDGTDSFPSRISLDSTIATSTFTTYNLVNKQYVDGVALQGAPTATGSTPGLLQIATRTDLSNGTAQSGAYTLVPSNAYFAYTPQNATSVPVSNASGKIAQGWLDLTQPWTFTGNVTHSATSTLAASPTAPLNLRGVDYSFPSSQGGATTTLINNGSGALTWGSLPGIAAATTTMGQVDLTLNATTVVASLTFTPSTAQRLLLNGGARVFNTTNAGDCYFAYTVDNAATTTIAGFKYGAGQDGTQNLSFNYLTNQVSAAQHTLKLLIYPVVGGCTITLTNPFAQNYLHILYMNN